MILGFPAVWYHAEFHVEYPCTAENVSALDEISRSGVVKVISLSNLVGMLKIIPKWLSKFVETRTQSYWTYGDIAFWVAKHLIRTGSVTKIWRNIMKNIKSRLAHTKEVCWSTLSVGLSIANRLYPAVLLQFLFVVVPCVFAWLHGANVDVRSAELNSPQVQQAMLLDLAIYKSYFFSFYDKLILKYLATFQEHTDLDFKIGFRFKRQYVVLWLRWIIIHGNVWSREPSGVQILQKPFNTVRIS